MMLLFCVLKSFHNHQYYIIINKLKGVISGCFKKCFYAKQTQFPKNKMNITYYKKRTYKALTAFAAVKNKPKQNQF